MVAGLRMRVTVHSVNQETDDSVGGAVFTGTSSYISIPAAIQYLSPSRLLLEQGAEVKRLAKVLVQPGSMTIYEQDELEVVGPVGHEDVGKLFKVISVDRTGLSPNDPRRILQLMCERFERHRNNVVGSQ